MKTNQTRKAFESIKAFLPNDKTILNIIKLCDLHPVGNSWRTWTDHLGNFLQINKNKKIISFSQSPLANEQIITDIYFKAPPSKLAKISNWAFVSFGKDQTNAFNTLYIWFLGRDNRLRFCAYHNNKWLKNESPLISGINTLRPILQNLNVRGYRQADILYVNGPVAVNITKSWATEWPPNQELIKEMNYYNKILTNLIINI